ncbi:hypothetical protein C8A01DRAFT_46514 [Parachaetomium inaequale]|uniref:Rhodopsin domain-containing protein n=1 Tax=Parachaetomium inaequale TaxID=2588326 RepID=A0AAN6SRP8_9PEZI|nr:hypothetical protein C8A01DRAFT_46514 [Parachaetomium inaequale]
MSSATTAPEPAATGAAGAPMGGATNGTVEFPGIPISERAAYLAQVYIGVSSVLLFLCVVTFGTRIYQRIRPVWKVGLDDYFIVAGFILTIADYAMLMPMMVPKAGLISPEHSTEAGKNSWLAISVWGLSMTCIKVSIALTLLRIQGKERGWRIFLYTIMAVQAVYGIGNTLFNLAIACQPLEAAWNPYLPGGHCVSFEAMRAVSNLGSSINITTDVLLSLAPATFLRKLNRPLRERVFVCVLMGMGLFASVFSIIKTVIVKDWGDPAAAVDFWAMGVSISTFTVLEQLLGVLAACVPAMKGIFQKCLGAMGVSLTENKSQQRSGYYIRQGGTGAGVGSRTGGGPTETYRSQKGDGFRAERRFSRRGQKEMYDDETCIDLPDLSRPGSTKSSGDRSSDHGQGDSRGHSVEQLPAHAV